MSTIYDVAKMANVSAMTVSRVLNNPEKVGATSRKRIEDAIKALGYEQNQAARALVSKSTGIVKIVLADKMAARDTYYMTLFAGISEMLSEKRLAQLVVRDTAPHIKSDGMIIMGLNAGQEIDVTNSPSPVVMFGKDYLDVDWVDVNNFDGVYQATKHLIDLGHKRIAFIAFQVDEPFIKEREAGYHHAMQEAGIEADPTWLIKDIKHSSIEAKAVALRVLRTMDFTAIVCASDIIALGVIQATKELNISVPRQLSVTGFDGVGIDLMTDPRLTTMKQPVFEIGRRLAGILVERINNKEKNYTYRHETISTTLEIRDSTAKI